MRAVVLDSAPWSLRVTGDWPEPRAGSGQVLVRVRGVGICGSDLALVSGGRRAPAYPWVPGHEAFGEVVATGAGVDPARAGQRVVIEPNYPCLRCPACRAGLTSMCQDRVVAGFNAPGLLAELVAVPAPFAWPVPDGWADTDAVCAEPLTVAMAAIRRGGVAPGGRCLVIGTGSQGLLLCVALTAGGITPYVVEPQPGRLDLAVSLGASPAPDGLRFGLVFETSGAQEALSTAVGRAAPGAMIMLIGLSERPVHVDTGRIVQRQLTVRGSLIYDHPEDFAATLKDSAGIASPGRVLRASYPLDQAPEAFLAAREVPGKTWIKLSRPSEDPQDRCV
jgi:2-desacetyl-2-hydroxyethyl bacteriochlorophyllide A dehydrogenase